MSKITKKKLEKVDQIIDELWKEELLFLQDIGSYESTLGNEKEIQMFIKEHLDDMNLVTTLFSPETEQISSYKNYGKPEWDYKDRPVLVGEWKSNGEKLGKSLILQGHIDIVSAEPKHLWEEDPFKPTITGNKMYGRGILDMKGGVAAIIYAVKALQKANIGLGADLQIQTVIEEECTGNGALALLDKGFVSDGALITEPTGHRAIHSQLGVIWIRVKVKGSGAHVERANEAQNSINKSMILIQALENYREHINSKPKHPDFINHSHPLNVNVGVGKGGDWPSSVPNEYVFEARVGFYPGTNPTDVQEEVMEWLLEASKQDDWLKENPPEITFFGFHAPGYTISKSSDLYKSIESAHKRTTNEEMESLAFTATTDIRAFGEFGIPATCYGPSGANMHAPNEYIDLDSLKIVTKTIAAFILDWCRESN